jgi:predicted lipoprotein with Yx(FWY)xxD motif
MRLTAVLAALAVTLVLAGHAMAADCATLTVGSSDYGGVLFDGKGFALYAFTYDPKGKSTCSGSAAAWPPYLVKHAPGAAAGAGARAGLLGTTRRAEGSVQVTCRGRPLYYYVGDRRPGRISQNVFEFAGLCLVAPTTLVRESRDAREQREHDAQARPESDVHSLPPSRLRGRANGCEAIAVHATPPISRWRVRKKTELPRSVDKPE